MWLKAASSRHSQHRCADLIPGSVYLFRVKAENPYGVSDPSDPSDAVRLPARCNFLILFKIKNFLNNQKIDSASSRR